MNPTQTPAHNDPTTADLLRRAADHVQRHGFNQGSYYDNPVSDRPAACAAGAIAIAAYGEPVATPEVSFQSGEEEYKAALEWMQLYLEANLDQHAGEPIGVYAWNDSPDTTAADVADMLCAAADSWDAENDGGDRS